MPVQLAEGMIVSKPAFTVAGMRYRGANQNQEIPQLWDQFGPKMGLIPQRTDPTVCYGICDNFNEETQEFDYIAACEVKPEADLPEGMAVYEIPAQTYAVFETTLPQIHETMEHIYSTWLPASEYQRAAGPEFEIYDETFDPHNSASKLYLYVPVVKA